ncbi:hypothetical protein MY11210_001186 [Beauveria gryllotalpidicola]
MNPIMVDASDPSSSRVGASIDRRIASEDAGSISGRVGVAIAVVFCPSCPPRDSDANASFPVIDAADPGVANSRRTRKQSL